MMNAQIAVAKGLFSTALTVVALIPMSGATIAPGRVTAKSGKRQMT